MLKHEREDEILALLRDRRRITVTELTALLFTSESSIRRDLAALETKGLVQRYYGGVELVENGTTVIPFAARTHQNITAKKTMAKKAAALVKKGQILFLDQSSSCFYLACELQQKSGLTILTNNVEILSLLRDSQLTVYASGGMLSPENRSCLIGEDAHEAFRQLHADYLFFSSKALSDNGIIYDCTRPEVVLRRTMMQNADKMVFLCDSGKFHQTAGYVQGTLSEVDHFISEKEPEEPIASLVKRTVIL